MKLQSIWINGLVVALLSSSASAGVIVEYDVESITSTVTTSQVLAINPASGVAGVNVTRGAGLTASSSSFSINSSGWNNLEATDYYEFGFTTTTAYLLDQLTVGLRSSNTGPGFVDLLYSKDGGAFTELTSVGPIELVGTQFANVAADLSEIGQVNGSLLFRLVVDPTLTTNAGFNQDPNVANPAIGSGGTFRFASYSPSGGVFLNPAITGEVAPAAVPEPSSLFLVGIAGVGIAGLTIRRRRPAA